MQEGAKNSTVAFLASGSDTGTAAKNEIVSLLSKPKFATVANLPVPWVAKADSGP
jgi:hypothetical protein